MLDPSPPTAAEIREWRTASGLTQEQAARRLGVVTRTVQAWESGETTPPAFLREALTVPEGK